MPLPQPPDQGAARHRRDLGRQTATLDEGFVSLYSGLDLRGWRLDAGPRRATGSAKDSVLEYDGKSAAKDKDLWTEKTYGDFILIADWRLPGKPSPRPRPVVLPNGDEAKGPDGKTKTLEIPYAGDSGILLRGQDKGQVNITCNTDRLGRAVWLPGGQTMPAETRTGSIPKDEGRQPRSANGTGS